MALVLRRLVVALATGLLASGSLALGAAPAISAPTTGACPNGAGVTVVVDFGSLGGGVETRCAPGPVKSGFDALTQAGFAITSVSGQAFLCRIDGRPADEPCNRIPSAARYWSYWHADRGGAWTYSSSGASRQPPPGSVEGWAFGDGDAPGSAPPGPITTTTSRPVPPLSTSPPPTTVGAVVAPPASPTAFDPPDPGGSATSVPTTASTTTTEPTAGVAEGDPDDDELVAPSVALTPTVTEGDTGSPTGVVVAGLLVGGLSAIGIRTVRRRSRDERAG